MTDLEYHQIEAALDNPRMAYIASRRGYEFDVPKILKIFPNAANSWVLKHAPCGRYETMTDEDKQFLKDCGISV